MTGNMASDLLEYGHKVAPASGELPGPGRPAPVRSGRRGPAYPGCGMKPCSRCRQVKPFAEFYSDRRSKTGYRSWCKTCVSREPSALAARQRYRKSERGRATKRRYRQRHHGRLLAEDEARRQAALARLDAIKLDRGCIDCGYRAHPAALDFDHRDPAKKAADISQIATHGWAKVQAEIAKCDVRCSNCHRVRTFENKHGRRRARPLPKHDPAQERLDFAATAEVLDPGGEYRKRAAWHQAQP